MNSVYSYEIVSEEINEEFEFKMEIRHCLVCERPLFINTLVKEENEKILCNYCYKIYHWKLGDNLKQKIYRKK
jgi:formylmethanofuran dehydrogenase subunit E